MRFAMKNDQKEIKKSKYVKPELVKHKKLTEVIMGFDETAN